MARNVVVTTARAMTKAARAATVAGATRTMATTATTAAAAAAAAAAATKTPNGDKHNNQILSQHQRCGPWW